MTLKYAVVFERAPDNFSAYVPDLPGCISAADSLAETRDMIREAIQFHIEGLQENGVAVELPEMSVVDAMAYHIALLAEDGEDAPDTETTVGMVEVDVKLAPLSATRR